MEFVRTTTSDDLILQGLLSGPETNTDSVILHIHGMSGNFWENGFIKTMLSEYPKQGCSFLSVETRGSELIRFLYKTNGSFVMLGNAYEIFEDSVKDIDGWINFLEKQGYKNIYLQGHSLGCAKVAYYQSLKKDRRVKALLLVSAADMLGLVLNPKDLPTHERDLSEAKDLIAAGRGEELLSHLLWGCYKLSAKTYVNFYGSGAKTAVFNYYNPELGYDVIREISVPIISIFGTKDDGIVTDPYKSNDIIKNNALKSPKFVGLVFEGAQHNYAGFEDQIVREVIRFVKEVR